MLDADHIAVKHLFVEYARLAFAGTLHGVNAQIILGSPGNFESTVALDCSKIVYVLVDNDPWGFYIYSVMKQGSINLAYESMRMAVPDGASRFCSWCSSTRYAAYPDRP